MSTASKLLDRLERVTQTGADRWAALCPAHEDGSPSLSIREKDDRVLIHCFAGCEAGDVLAAVGLRFADLYERPLSHYLPPIKGGFSARELLELNAHETDIVMMLAVKAAAGGALTTDELGRLETAAARLGKARACANVR